MTTLAHALSVPVGKLTIHYEWHREMQPRREGDNHDRFKAIWTIIRVPLKLTRITAFVAAGEALHERYEVMQTMEHKVADDWCSPLMIKQLVLAYLEGMVEALRSSPTDASDPANVLAAMAAL